MTTATENELSVDAATVPGKEMTAEEFDAWAFAQELVRYEWVEGTVIRMAPASLEHVDLNGWLLALVSVFVEQRDLGSVYGPELLVRLSNSRRVPDLSFLKKENLHRAKPTYLDGAADLAVEIISNDSVARDWREKYLEYESAGVGEYWVIDPASHVVECYALGEHRKFHPNSAKDDKISSAVLAGFYLRPSWLWQKPLPRVAGVLREMGITL